MIVMDRRAVLLGIAGVSVMPSSSVTASTEIEAALDAIGDARFIAIGERHDNPAHHAVQAEIVLALQPAGIAFEMIPQAGEKTVNRLRREGASRDQLAAALDWAESGWPDFAFYAPIMEAAPDAYIAGGGLSRKSLSAIYAKGAPGLGEEMTARYGLDEPLAADVEAAMLNEQYEAHCGLLDRAKLSPMVAVQRAWDAAYAEAWRRAGLHGEGPVVLICGNAHARLGSGAPAYLAKAMPEATIASIGQIEDGDDPAQDGFYTATIRSTPPERGDPCEQMRKSMAK